MNPVAAVMVLYSPPGAVNSNINSCLEQVERLYLVDNSDQPVELLGEILADARVTYVWNGGNRGLAYALNQGAILAMEDGYRCLLTLDQDSWVEAGMVDALYSARTAELGKVGILAPGELVGVDVAGPPSGEVSRAVTVWTSGSLLDLAAYLDVGPFREDLFIDFVDHEFCLRLNNAGFGVFRVGGARLRHCYGEKCRRIQFFGKAFWITNHVPLRRYYIMRNRLLLRSLYAEAFPNFFRKEQLCMLMEILAVLFFESHKCEKYLMMARGVRDFKSGTLGRFNG